MQKRIKSTNYIVVSGWMVNELHLKGNELLIYAIIYGFTQDNKSWFEGTRYYLASFIGCKEIKTISNILNKLIAKGYIIKDTQVLENNTLYVRYKAVIPTIPETTDWLNM